MAEIVTFNSTVDPPKTVFRISLLSLDLFNSRIDIHLREWNGTDYGDRLLIANYTGPIAMNLMIALNKANLTIQSLQQRIFTQLLADGKIPPGTQSGSVS